MNTSVSKDLIRKPQKRISKRNKKGQGFFHNNHSFNLLNRNSSLQTHSYSEYVLQNPNARSYNLKLHSGRPNSGYLKHIHSQSIRREKEHSAMGCYEEYTLRKIRNTSDMIKQQLMSPEHVPISLSDTHLESSDTLSVSKNKPLKLGGDSSKIPDINKEYLSTKPKRKLGKSNEEIVRLQMKEKRKNELREKFKRDNISKQKPSETYNAKEISDLILKHISKMNNERIMDFLNSGDSRYGEAFNYICKQKSFEVTKALRDLSHQEKPEACEIVNAIIPDFSIKIEQLPINVIKELSLTFDELHKNIGDTCLTDENSYLFNGECELQSSDDLSAFLQQFQNDETYEENLNTNELKTEIQIDSTLFNQGLIENAEGCGNSIELIEVFDSEEEIVYSEKTDAIEESIDSTTQNCISSINQIACLNTGIDENNASDTQGVEKDLLENISLNTNPSYSCENNSIEIAKELADSTSLPLMDSVKVEVNPETDEKSLPLEETDLNSQPKVGTVWVRKNIFESSSNWNILQEHEINEPLAENFTNLENLSVPFNNIPPPNDQNLESASCGMEDRSHNTSLLSETNDSQIDNTAIVEENVFEPTLSNKNNSIMNIGQVDEHNNTLCSQEVPFLPFCTSQSFIPSVDAEMNISSILTPTKENSSQVATDVNKKSAEVKDTNIMETLNKGNSSQLATDANKKSAMVKDSNLIEKTRNLGHEFDIISNESSNFSVINKDLNFSAQSSNVDEINLVKNRKKTCTSENDCSPNDFISLTIKPFDKPKNLKDAINFMTFIDKQIEILNKLRQEIFYGLSGSSVDSEITTPKSKKRKLEKSNDLLEESPKISNGNKKQFNKRLVQKNSSNNEQTSANEKESGNKKQTDETIVQKNSLITEKTNANEIQIEKGSVQQSNSIKKLGNERLTETRLPENGTNAKILNRDETQVGKRPVQENTLNTKISSPHSSRKDKKTVQEIREETSSNASVSSQKNEVASKPIRMNDPKPFQSLHCIKAVVLFCKMIFEKNECIVGTDDGKIHYHSVYGYKPLMTVNIGESSISFLECVRINDWYYVFTGTTTQSELKILKYKKRYIEQKIRLEDSISAVKNDWGFFFIGGKRGYLTRYDWRRNKIQFEDRISQSGIKALTATKEGPRKILVILFEDTDGVAHIHVRDAMSALHIRTIIDMKNVRSMYLRYSSVYLVTDEQISVYNCCDGNFVRKVTTQKPFSIVKSKGNLMILVATDGIYGYNMRTNKYLGCLKEKVTAESLFIYERMILCGTSSKTVEVFDIPEHCNDILEYK